MEQFHKVSTEQFVKDCINAGWPKTGENSIEDAVIIMPKRATERSAGYDIYAPINFLFRPGESITIPTGLSIELGGNRFLMIVPRSGLGSKYQLGLANTVGIIDADYYNNPTNEGHIIVKMVNRGNQNCFVEAGTAFCQAIIVPFDICTDDTVVLKRLGGFGSTDREGS